MYSSNGPVKVLDPKSFRDMQVSACVVLCVCVCVCVCTGKSVECVTSGVEL
jgi:hypothetical protein